MKHNLKIGIAAILCIVCFDACSNQKNDAFTNEDWLSLAIKTEKYIQQSKYHSDVGVTWRVMPDSIDSKGDNSLYSGSPGIVLFYLELHKASANPFYLEEAKLGADYLINTLHDSIYLPNEVGLYTGLAGLGFTFTEVYKSTNDHKYHEAAIDIVNLLELSAIQSENGIHWGFMTDIVYGSSGIGLFLQYIAEELKSSQADSLSILVANELLEIAIESPSGLRWKMSPYYDRFMDNFSHGTSGVAYFLSQTYLKTKNQKYLDAAISAAELLDSVSNDKGYIPHHLPGGEDLYYLNWCHGPAGTSRLFYSLYVATKDEDWLNKMKQTADHLMEEGIHEHQTDGYWNNVGKCCGAAGVAEYYFWLYTITGNMEYLEYSATMTDQLIMSSTEVDDYLKWTHAENRSSPGNVAAQTGLMQGSAGIGLWFLHLYAHINQSKNLITLPDKPQVK
ncbi:MAG: hypothetical protein HN352_08075 [Bacteroidetes bacterium]|nr:hypothetical protein [Bacteroidota bacterium]MBT3748581.1 hypothetical protein [Bacteroidota bacterium]MBT4412025.1 hypothetical protein [Bacteroidota bacterium]MBT5427579.1 hypothetical protein [Bacteroidota bacterium]MBT7465745.1 hypothetical protein [Bacteroidota bacterium]